MQDSPGPTQPYVPAEKRVPETTVLAVGLGLLLAIVMGAANTYLGLKAGMTVSASIPAAVVSMAILRGIFRRGTILENNIAQTIASTGESLAAGVIFTVPALIMIGAWQDFEFWPTTLIVMFGGLLGVVFMVPLRRALIVERPDLIYPEGVACSEVLIAGQEGGTGIIFIGIGLATGAVFKFLATGLGLIRDTVEAAVASGRSIFYAGTDMSVMLIAVGYIVNLGIATQIFLGGVIGWVIALPLIPLFTGVETVGVPLDDAWELWSSQVRYIGVGAMLVGGVYSIWAVRRGIVGGITSLQGIATTVPGADEIPRTDRDMPFMALFAIFVATFIGTAFLYNYLIDNIGVSVLAAIIMTFAAFLFVAVATYIAGLVGSSNSPVSGMTICALIMTAAVFLALGIEGDSAMLATLGVAGVVCCAACTSGDIAQDLKTGLLVGATPARQQWAEIVGVIIPAFIFAPVLSSLHKAYGIGDGLRAPQAALFASLTEGFFGDGVLPRNMIVIGAVLGIAIIVIDNALAAFGSKFRLHIMPVAVGIYLPVALGVPIFIGGLIRYITNRRAQSRSAGHDPGILFGSGLIAGEALMGIGLAVPISMGFEMWNLSENWADWATNSLSLAIFALIIAAYWWIVSRPKTTLSRS